MLPITIGSIIDETKNGELIVIRPNQIFIVRLKYHNEELHDVDWRWLLDKDGRPNLLLLDSYPGAADMGVGTHQWRFKALLDGTTTVVMSYKQTWTSHPRKRFGLTVKVSSTADPYPQERPTHPIGS